MNKGFIKVGALSPEVSVANPENNLKSAIEAIKEANRNNAQIIALPELFISGYTCADLFFQKRLISRCEDAIGQLLKLTKKYTAVIIIGAPVLVGSRLYNCAVVMQGGKILGIVPKSYLPDNDEFSEKRWFAPGVNVDIEDITYCGQETVFGNMLFEIDKDITLGVEICEDLYVPVSPSSIMSLSGANVIVNISANPDAAGKSDAIRKIIRQQSLKALCAYIYSSAGFGESSTDLVFSGDCIIAQTGKILSAVKSGNSTYACIDIEQVNIRRQRKTSFADNADIYSENYPVIPAEYEISVLSDEDIDIDISASPFVPKDSNRIAKRSREVLDIQVSGLIKRLKYIGHEKVVLGISGGLDSTLALLVASEAIKKMGLPSENIICVTMPGFGTTDATLTGSHNLIDAFGATKLQISIVDTCTQHLSDIGHDINIHDATYENAQARERTQILMDLANKENALLIGTGDLSEMALGWCTYNGDHMSMYCVNASVPKTLIQCMLGYFATVYDENISNAFKAVLETPISPELLPPDKDGKIAQKTEDTIGPYEVHDFFLYHFIRYGTAPDKLLFLAERAFGQKYTADQLKVWLKLFIKRFFNNQFKRSCSPDGPKTGSVSLSPRGGLKMPSDADFSAWLD